MEFWIGLSVGMHLGGFLAKHLENLIESRGLLSQVTCEEIKRIEEVEAEASEIFDEVVK